MKGILLAAGRGTRLKPLTDTTPKPLLPVNGQPILTIIMKELRKIGITEIALIIGYLGEKIQDHYGDGSSLGIKIEYFHQEKRNGTAGAVLPALSFLSNHPFFLGYGDILVAPENYPRILAYHVSHPDQSILAGWSSSTPWAGGVLETDSRNRLINLIEKPSRRLYEGQALHSPGNLINAGLMILQPSILECIQKVEASERGELELTDALLSHAQKTHLHVLTLKSFWSDIGTPEKLHEANMFFRDRLVNKGMA